MLCAGCANFVLGCAWVFTSVLGYARVCSQKKMNMKAKPPIKCKTVAITGNEFKISIGGIFSGFPNSGDML